MKIVKIILITLISIIVLLLAVSFFLPSKARVQRTLQMKSKPEQVYKLVNNFKNWNQWSPWHKKDTAAIKTYNDIKAGKGATYSWKSIVKGVGSGKLTIVESVENKNVDLLMEFNGMGATDIHFMMEPNDSGQLVSWILESDISSVPFYLKPIKKIMNLMMDKFVGPDFESGLKSLKDITEHQKNETVAGFEAAIKERPELHFAGIRNKLKGEEISTKFKEYIGLLTAEIKKQGIEQSGGPFSINYYANGDIYDIMVCIPVKSPIKESEEIKPGYKAATNALVIEYYGSYMHTGSVYMPGFEYLAHHKLNASGAPMEFYITDPVTVKDSSLWLTEVVIPCM